MISDMSKPTILITSVGSRVGQAILASIDSVRETFRVVGTSSATNDPAIYECDASYYVPVTLNKKAFTSSIRSILQSEQPNLVFAGRDEDLLPLSQFRCDDAFKETIFLGPDLDSVSVLNDKYATWKFSKEHSLAFAKSAIRADEVNLLIKHTGFPIICKPRRDGNASRDVWIISEQVQVDLALQANRFVFQEYIECPYDLEKLSAELKIGIPLSFDLKREFITGAGVVDKLGKLRSASVLMTTHRGGFPKDAFSSDDVAMHAILKSWSAALNHLSFRGPFNIQALRNKDGAVIPFEINARVSGSAISRAILGGNLVLDTINHFVFGEELPSMYRLEKDKVINRQIVDRWVSTAEMDKFKNTGRI